MSFRVLIYFIKIKIIIFVYNNLKILKLWKTI